jgi:hypothetical protein
VFNKTISFRINHVEWKKISVGLCLLRGEIEKLPTKYFMQITLRYKEWIHRTCVATKCFDIVSPQSTTKFVIAHTKYDKNIRKFRVNPEEYLE